MRVSTTEFYRLATQDLLSKQSSLSEQQLRISAGRNILKPSDDPIGSALLVDIQNSLDAIDQLTRNAGRAESRLGVTEEALAAATSNLQRVRELTVQGANATQNDESRNSIAREIRQRLAELLSIANSSDANGEYIFAGNQTSTEPFRFDGSVRGGVAYDGDDGQRMVSIDPARQVAVNESGRGIFMAIREGNATFTTAREPRVTIRPEPVVAQPDAGNGGSGAVGDITVSEEGAFAAGTPPYTLSFADDGSGGLSYTVVNDDGDALVTGLAFSAGATISDIPGVAFRVEGAPQAGDSIDFAAVAALGGGAAVSPVRVVDPARYDGERYTLAFSEVLPATTPSSFTFSILDAAGAAVDPDGAGPLGTAIPYTDSTVVSISGLEFTLAGVPVDGQRFSLEPGNSGTGSILPGEVINPALYDPLNYAVRFNEPADSFDILVRNPGSTPEWSVLDGAGGSPLAGIAYASREAGQVVTEIPGIRFTISGEPAPGDTFNIEPAGRKSVFGIYEELAQALETPLSTPQGNAEFQEDIGRVLEELDQVLVSFNEARADVGGRLRVVETQVSLNADRELQYEGARSRIDDLDLAEAITQLQLQITAFQASQQSFIRIQNLSLFDIIG